MEKSSTSPVLSGLLVIALLGCVTGLGFLWKERQSLLQEIQSLRHQRDELNERVQSLGSQLQTTSTRLADLRKQGLKIYTLEIPITFSGITINSQQPVNLAVLATLSATTGTTYRFTNPDLTVGLDEGKLNMILEAEDPSALIGHEISGLAQANSLQINVSSLFKLAGIELSEDAQFSYAVRINGIPVIERNGVQALPAMSGPLVIDVSQDFSDLESRYAAAIGLASHR